MTLPIASAPELSKFGSSLADYLYEVDSPTTRAMLQQTIKEFLEKDANVNDVTVSYKGNGAFDVGVFYTPHVPLQTVNVGVTIEGPTLPEIEHVATDGDLYIFVIRRQIDDDFSDRAMAAIRMIRDGIPQAYREFEDSQDEVRVTILGHKNLASKIKLLFT